MMEGIFIQIWDISMLVMLYWSMLMGIWVFNLTVEFLYWIDVHGHNMGWELE